MGTNQSQAEPEDLNQTEPENLNQSLLEPEPRAGKT